MGIESANLIRISVVIEICLQNHRILLMECLLLLEFHIIRFVIVIESEEIVKARRSAVFSKCLILEVNQTAAENARLDNIDVSGTTLVVQFL